jgi:hypothetical protein
MEGAIRSHHPSLDLGQIRIPGPAITIAVLAFALFIRSHTRGRVLSSPVCRHGPGDLLDVLHLLFYACNIYGISTGEEYLDNNTLPLVEYLSLVVGEAALQKSSFWLYTSVALGWSVPVPLTLFILQSPHLGAIVSLTLSAPSALDMSEHASIGVTLSALSLLTRAMFWISKTPTAGYTSSATNFAGILLPLLARTCYTAFIRTSWGRSWHNKLKQALQSWLRSVQPTNSGHCIECAQISVAAQSLLISGWVMSSFVWSCFRWRWLFSRQASRAPAWSAASFLAGTQFFTAFALVKWARTREATADVSVFMQRQLNDCLVATWWTSFLFTSLWLISEALDALLSTFTQTH